MEAQLELSVLQGMAGVKDIRGFTNRDQLWALHEAARDIKADGETVEIGCFMGRSTAAIGLGLKARDKGEHVIVIDQFAATPGTDGKLEWSFSKIDNPKQLFLDKMEELGVPVELHAVSDEEARTTGVVKGPVRFAFIDGDHSYEGVKRNIEWLLPLMAPGGVMSFDDVLTAKTAWRGQVHKWGVRRAVEELVIPVCTRMCQVSNGQHWFMEVNGDPA